MAARDPKALLRAEALRLGFDAVGFAPAALAPEAGQRLAAFLAAGRQGDMGWLAERAGQRASPDALWPAARSAVVVAQSYAPAEDPLANLADGSLGNVSVYARNRDYHDLMKGRLKHLAQFAASRLGGEAKVFVDTAPVMEKPLAQLAGLGWQGKHSNLLSRELGNWFFLGSLLTTLELAPDPPGEERCGSCRACLEACPTAAFPAPFQLDARRCLSYLTIEHPGPIPLEFRRAMGNRIYGCDDCLAVCPWNRFAQATREAKLRARADLVAPPLAELVRLDEAGFRQRFAGSAVKRIGHARFLRNVLIAIGNSGVAALLPAVLARLEDASPLVRGAATWAYRRLAPGAALAEAPARRAAEVDAAAAAEWD
jgi:epoxyqueuosine reductase